MAVELWPECRGNKFKPNRPPTCAEKPIADSLDSPITRLWPALSIIPDTFDAGISSTTDYEVVFHSSCVRPVIVDPSTNRAFSHFNGIDAGFLSQLDRLIDLYLDQQDVSLERFCRLTSLSPSKLRRALSKEGTSLYRRVDERRKMRAQALLLNSDLELPQVGNLVGFPEPASFSRTFRRWTGMPPGKFRQSSKN